MCIKPFYSKVGGKSLIITWISLSVLEIVFLKQNKKYLIFGYNQTTNHFLAIFLYQVDYFITSDDSLYGLTGFE